MINPPNLPVFHLFGCAVIRVLGSGGCVGGGGVVVVVVLGGVGVGVGGGVVVVLVLLQFLLLKLLLVLTAQQPTTIAVHLPGCAHRLILRPFLPRAVSRRVRDGLPSGRVE